MERLTKRSDFTGLVLIDGKGYGEAYFGAKEDFDRITKALNKLAAYEDAEEHGRLVVLPESTPDIDFVRILNLIMADADGRVIVLPCKVGDTVWTNLVWSGWYFRKSDKPYSAKIIFVGINDSKEMGGGFMNVLYDEKGHMNSFQFSDIGKSVFLTREEAEKALEGMG